MKTLVLVMVSFASLVWISRSKVAKTQLCLSHVETQSVKPALASLWQRPKFRARNSFSSHSEPYKLRERNIIRSALDLATALRYSTAAYLIRYDRMVLSHGSARRPRYAT